MKRLFALSITALPVLALADATPTTNDGAGIGGGFWGFLIGIGAFVLIQFIKPEWFIGWLLNLIESKFQKKEANALTNALGTKLIEVGLVALEKIPDDDNPTIAEGVQKIKEGVEMVKKEFKLSK